MCLKFALWTYFEISTSSASVFDAFILGSSENLNTESSESFWFLQGTEDWNQFCEHSASMA